MIEFNTEVLVPIVVLACLIIGYTIKNTDILHDRLNGYIPLILAIVGATLGCIANHTVSLESVVFGALSGLASTGLHQTFTRVFMEGDDNDDSNSTRNI